MIYEIRRAIAMIFIRDENLKKKRW
jgi:hypothetical protein